MRSEGKMKLHVTIPAGTVRDEFLTNVTMALLDENFEVSKNELGRNYTSEEMLDAVKDAEVVITGWGTPSFIGAPDEKIKSLKLIAHTAGSVAALVDESIYQRGVRVVSGNELFAESVAEGTIAYMLSMLRKIPDDINGMRDGVLWKHESGIVTRGIIGRDIGIVGFGMITRHLLKMLKPFHPKIKIFSRYPIDEEFLKEYGATSASIEEVFSSSVVTLHSSLTPSSVGMVGKKLLSLMPKGAVFINTARGAIVNEKELIEVLAEGSIYAVLDVFEKEPLDMNSPLRKMPNVYVLPHMAGPTHDRRCHIGLAVAEDAVRFANGEPLRYELSGEYAKRMTR